MTPIPNNVEASANAATMAIGEVRYALLPADRTTTSTDFADVEGLAFPIDAGAEYLFEAFAIFRSGNVLNCLGLAINGPAAPTAVVCWTQIATGLTTMVAGAARAYDSGTPAGLIDSAGANSPASLVCSIRNGANAGTLALRFKSALALATTTIMAGSCARLTRTA